MEKPYASRYSPTLAKGSISSPGDTTASSHRSSLRVKDDNRLTTKDIYIDTHLIPAASLATSQCGKQQLLTTCLKRSRDHELKARSRLQQSEMFLFQPLTIKPT